MPIKMKRMKRAFAGLAGQVPGTVVRAKLLLYAETFDNAPFNNIVRKNRINTGFRLKPAPETTDITKEKKNKKLDFLILLC